MGRTIPSFRIASVMEERENRNHFVIPWISQTGRYLNNVFDLFPHFKE